MILIDTILIVIRTVSIDMSSAIDGLGCGSPFASSRSAVESTVAFLHHVWANMILIHLQTIVGHHIDPGHPVAGCGCGCLIWHHFLSIGVNSVGWNFAKLSMKFWNHVRNRRVSDLRIITNYRRNLFKAIYISLRFSQL